MPFEEIRLAYRIPSFKLPQQASGDLLVPGPRLSMKVREQETDLLQTIACNPRSRERNLRGGTCHA